MNDAAIEEIQKKLDKLRTRIKNTSSVRFFAAKRVRLDYQISQLTVVILSLWSIVISYILAMDLAAGWRLNVPLLTAIGVVLPVFIVVFSLLENGEAFLRSYKLEANARQLRELSDQLYTASAVKGLAHDELLNVYDQFSQRYSDALERTPVNHDDTDHVHRVLQLAWDEQDVGKASYMARAAANWAKINFKRGLYIAFWFTPAFLIH